ncbi:hypothetical protein [Hymenobacter lapidarius]|nr:hypothetical protein [Hymenobacter lapidarius]
MKQAEGNMPIVNGWAAASFGYAEQAGGSQAKEAGAAAETESATK